MPPKSLILKAFGFSDIGKRKNNEDAYLVDERTGLFIVADGMGGHSKGEVASWFSSDNLKQIVSTIAEQKVDETLAHGSINVPNVEYNDLLEYAVLRINKNLCDENEKELAGQTTSDAKLSEIEKNLLSRSKMGTTLVSLLIRGYRGWLVHVGDSRAYKIMNGNAHLLTHDHSWANEQIRKGLLTPEEAKTHKKRNVIMRSLGYKPELDVDIDVITMNPPERFILCSDGLSNMLEERDIKDFCSSADALSACKQMVETAKLRGGKDNITAVIVDVLEPTEETSNDPSHSADRGETDTIL